MKEMVGRSLQHQAYLGNRGIAVSLVVGRDRRASGEASSGTKTNPTPTLVEGGTSRSTTGTARREPAGDGEAKRRGFYFLFEVPKSSAKRKMDGTTSAMLGLPSPRHQNWCSENLRSNYDLIFGGGAIDFLPNRSL